MDRRTRHARLSAVLAARDDEELAALVDTGRTGSVGIGGDTALVDVGDVPVFVKRITLTEVERSQPHSTANLFGLPLCYQYGICSPGFTAWRELAANRLVTCAVLAGDVDGFPLLHHWRVLPGRPPLSDELAAIEDDPAVRARLAALATATWSLVLFSEYVPHALTDWLRDDPAGKAETVERQLADLVDFLRDRELLHMDGHFGNLRFDGERIHLTDFGLVTSPRFDLSAGEREFVRRNAAHDADYAAMRLVNWLVTTVCGVDTEPAVRNEYVRHCAAGHIPGGVPPHVAAILTRHAPAAARSNDLYWQLFSGRTGPPPAGGPPGRG